MTIPVRQGVADQAPRRLSDWLLRWETILVALLVVVIVGNTAISPYFLDIYNLSDATYTFSEKAIVALAMALLIITREIDLSVAAIIALASTAMGVAMTAGFGTPVLVLVGIGTGLVCGAINGFFVARLGLPSIVVTIGTMSLFRGISYIILGDQAFTGYPDSFAFFGQGYVWWVFSFELLLFAIFAVVYWALLHRTNFGRAVYAIGNNPVAALFCLKARLVCGRSKEKASVRLTTLNAVVTTTRHVPRAPCPN
jgi:rhamnose transport system permease protein